MTLNQVHWQAEYDILSVYVYVYIYMCIYVRTYVVLLIWGDNFITVASYMYVCT